MAFSDEKIGRERLSSDHRETGCGAILLAGGQSRRMGQDKALLSLGGEALAVRAHRLLSRVCDPVVVVRDPSRGFPLPEARLVNDRFPGCGPLEGLASGLEALKAERALLMACDMPFVPEALLRHLVELDPDADVVVPETPHGLEPLLAVYARHLLPLLRSRLASGERRMQAIFPQVRVHVVSHEEVLKSDPDARAFMNLNRPEDFQAVLKYPEAPDSTDALY